MSLAPIGRYTLQRELGRGGMATVYQGYDPRFRRDVAIKVLPREFLHNPTFHARFSREAEIIAALEHPAIVPVYDVGEDDGQPYIVMRLMPGGSLADRLAAALPPLEEAVRIVERVAAGLDHAHSRGVIHRDLKPGNILFDLEGHPYLSDFGIARLGDSSSTLSGGMIVGSPAYMSPEQCRGDASIDGRTDVYALGVVVYQLLTRAIPYAADTPAGTMLKHLTDPVPRVRAARPDLPPAFDTLIQKALAKDRDRRFATAGALAAQFGQARTASTASANRPAWLLGAGGAALLLAVCALAAGAVALAAVQTNRVARQTATAAALAASVLGVNSPAPPTTVRTATVAPSGTSPVLATGTLPATSASLSPSATAAALRLTAAVLGGGSGRLLYHSDAPGRTGLFLLEALAGTGQQVVPTAFQAHVQGSDWSPDGQQVVFASDQLGRLQLFIMRADGTDPQALTSTPRYNQHPAWSPNGEYIAFVSSPTFNTLTGYELMVVRADGTGLTQLTDNDVYDDLPSWSPDGTQLVFASDRDGNTEVYTMAADGSAVVRLTHDPANDGLPDWSPDGSQIAFWSNRGNNHDIYVMQAEGGAATRLTTEAGLDISPTWSPDGTRLAFISDRDGNREVYWMLADGSQPTRLTANTSDETTPRWQP